MRFALITQRSSPSLMSSMFGTDPVPSTWILIAIDANGIGTPHATFTDEAIAKRTMDLLNRNGMVDVDLPAELGGAS